MGLVVVTGVGPRTGTSFIMQQAKEQGLPVYGDKFITGVTIPKHNPLGYYETTNLTSLPKHGVIKLWGNQLNTVGFENISSLLLLERKDKFAQLESINKVLKDELKLNPYIQTSAEEIFYSSIEYLAKWSKEISCTNNKHVYTEDLNAELDSILSFMKGGL